MVRIGPPGALKTPPPSRVHRQHTGGSSVQPTTQDRHERTYDARLLDGPRGGTRVKVVGLPEGGPVEVLPVHEDERGVYLLAGNPDLSGTLPYRWLTRAEAAALRKWLWLGRAG